MQTTVAKKTYFRSLLLATSIFCACSSLVNADANAEINTLLKQDPQLQITWNETQSKAIYLSGQLSTQHYKNSQHLVDAFIQQHRGLIGLPTASKLMATTSASTPAGEMLSYKQMHKGLDVVGAKLVARVHQGQLTTLANHLVTDLDISPTPSIERAAAISLAAQDLGQAQLNAEKIDLVYLTWEGSQYLAWRVLFPQQQQPVAQYQVWIDAHSGEVILTENRIESFARPSHQPINPSQIKAFKPTSLPTFFSLTAALNESESVELAGSAIGQGKGLDGKLKKFKTYRNSNGHYLLHSRQGSNPALSYYTYELDYSDEDLKPKLLKDADNVWKDPAAVDAYTKAMTTLNFYRSLGPLNAWYKESGLSQGVRSVVHVRDIDIPLDNAYWNGQAMYYGDGSTIFYPLAGSLDIVAHELTHAVSDATTNLIYCNESGALNESWSDVIAMLLSLKRGDAQPYLIAEDVMKIKTQHGMEGRYALRRMDDPAFRSDQYANNDFSLDRLKKGEDVWGQPASTSEQYVVRRCTSANDLGGVHINSGIVNRAAYLASQTLGHQVTNAVYYQALFYLSSTSTFKDARAALKQAATDLYGANSATVKQIESAFTTVGIN